nr:hypothetical protein [Sphingomonas sp.]
MNPKNVILRRTLERTSTEPSPQAKPGHQAPPTVEQFDRERMGIAAKE